LPEFKKTIKQEEATRVLASPVTNIMCYGGSGSGKTFLLMRCLIIRALKLKSRHIIFRQAFSHIKSSIWYNSFPEVMSKCFPEMTKDVHYWENKTDWFITFDNGSEIWFGGLDDKDRTEKVLGNEYSTIYVNECSMVSYNSVLLVRTRLRQSSGLKLKLYYDCNPPDKKHWTYSLFIEKKDPMGTAKIKNSDDYAFVLMKESTRKLY